MPPQYKFVEVSPVTEEALDEHVNDWVQQGWQLEGIRFVTTEHSKRPSIAFVSFIREAAQATVDREPPRKPRPLVRDADRDDHADGADGGPRIVSDDDGPAVLTARNGADVD
ncbi:MAG TPA: hypothetical protein VFQ53_00765 [Kofleriaceae bacterium]|nr:hypothetical protein [Kofleriaceae bacterium]